MDPRRSERIAETIREELEEILNYELSDPRIRSARVTEVLWVKISRTALTGRCCNLSINVREVPVHALVSTEASRRSLGDVLAGDNVALLIKLLDTLTSSQALVGRRVGRQVGVGRVDREKRVEHTCYQQRNRL